MCHLCGQREAYTCGLVASARCWFRAGERDGKARKQSLSISERKRTSKGANGVVLGFLLAPKAGVPKT